MESSYGVQWLQVLAVMAIGVTAGEETKAQTPPPSKQTRDKVHADLKKAEQALQQKTSEIDEKAKFQQNLYQCTAALESLYNVLAKEAGAKTESDKMRMTITKLQAIQAEAGHKEVNALKAQVKTVLAEYYKTADPKMIAGRLGIVWDSNFSFDTHAEFLKLTGGDNPRNWLQHFGLVAEYTEHTYYSYLPTGAEEGEEKSIELKGITQHEQITTKIMYDTATQLLRRKIPGTTAPIARVGMMINYPDLKNNPEAFHTIFGHQVDVFRPKVINNSTRNESPLHELKTFHELLDMHTKGEGTVSIKSDNGTITYGLPPISLPIVGSSSGNDGWYAEPNNTIIKNFYPNHINIGSVSKPALKNANRRDDDAPLHIDKFTSTHAGMHALIARPRWNPDGTPTKIQYLNPNYANILEDHLWRLAGHPGGMPSADELRKIDPAKVAILQKDKAEFIKVIRKNESIDADGRIEDLRGTSFAIPVANGVLLAASILYPDASNAELIDAFCSSCVPITHRQWHNFFKDTYHIADDVDWNIRPKGIPFSEKGGFGNFELDDKGGNDSFTKMLNRLEAMKQERLRIARRNLPPIVVGEGANKKTFANNGQPPPVTLELNDIQEVVTDASKKRAEDLKASVIAAFKNIEDKHAISLLKESNPIAVHIQNREYKEALALLRENHADTMKTWGKKDAALTAAQKAVNYAELMRQHTYQFTVHGHQDMCCMLAAMRLQFKDKTRPDNYVILESPDGTRIDLTMSESRISADDPEDDTFLGSSVTSTPGFMRQSAVGTWKLYTRQALDKEGTLLVLCGTLRDKARNILDVRELVLPGIELQEPTHKKIPSSNIVPSDGDPHERLRRSYSHARSAPQKAPKAASSAAKKPAFEDYLQRLIDNSELKKAGYIPEGTFQKMILHNERRVTDAFRFMTSLDLASKALGDTISGGAGDPDYLLSLIADSYNNPDPLKQVESRAAAWGYMAGAQPGDAHEPVREIYKLVQRGWGELASMMANQSMMQQNNGHASRIPDGIGRHALLNRDDVPLWHQSNQQFRDKQARKASPDTGRNT